MKLNRPKFFEGFSWSNKENLTGTLLRGGVGSVVIRITNVFLGAILTVFLARLLGPTGYGTYIFIFSLVSIIAIPAQFGIPRLVVRETARAQVNDDWPLMRGMWRWATGMVLTFSLVLVGAGLIGALYLQDRFSDLQLNTFFIGLLLVPLMALGALRGAMLQGLRRVVLGQLPEIIIRPSLLLLILLVVACLSSSGINADRAMEIHAVAALGAFAVGGILLYYNRPQQLTAKPDPVYRPKAWLMAIWPLALTAGMQQVNKNTDIIMLGYFLTAEDVGIFRVAVQGAMLVVFGQQAISMLVAPYYARLYAQGDKQRLQQTVTMSGRLAFSAAIIFFFVFLFWGKDLLRLFFGVAFISAYIPLVILGLGQLINSMFGHVGGLLNMTGHERDHASGVAIAAGCNILLNIILIPLFGMVGAAIATSITMVMWNYLLWRSVKKKLDIESSIFY